MKNLSLLFTVFILSINVPVWAQTKHTISGTIKLKASGEELIGAIVKIKELPTVGAASNDYGFYSLTIVEGSYTLVVTSVGSKTIEKKISLTQNLKENFAMEDYNSDLSEVVITSKRKDENVTSNEMGVTRISMNTINKLPVIMGEKDIIKAIQLTPGVKTSGDGNSGFFVRGGAADQNLILLDEAPVYNASHLLGFFSTFNSDAIKDVAIYKGTMPAEFGGRLSSVLDVKMNEGNNQDYHISGGVGLISSKLKVEGPIQKGKSSFLISGRRTYADLFLKLSNDDGIKNSSLYFYDLNAKFNYQINENNKLYFSGYLGQDKLGYKDLFGFDWRNMTGTLRWNHIASSKLFSNTSLIFSDYRYSVGVSSNNIDFKLKSNIQDINLKQDFAFYANNKHTIKFGANSIYHSIVPGNIVAGANSGILNTDIETRYAWENALFVSDDWKLNNKVSINAGIRVSTFSLLGAGTFKDYDAEGNEIGSQSFGKGDFVKSYIVPEPRLSVNYLLNKQSSLKAAFTRNAQYLHLLSNSNAGSPTDLWIPSTENVKPEISEQYTLGYYRNFKDNMFEFSTEVYYKDLHNQIDYKNGAVLNLSDKIESQLLFGKGRAYGVEFFLKKKVGRFNGWVGYTLSRTERQIAGINNNDWYAARQDKTHDISVVGIYDLTKRWTFSAAFVYSTGSAVTFPSGKYEVDGQVYFKYDERNGSRLPAYHRLDLAATYTRKKSNYRESSWAFSLYNSYGRENTYSVFFQQNEDNPQQTEASQVALFKFVPSISYNFKF